MPLQLGHLGNGPAMGFWSMTDLTRTAPAKTPRPVASWVNTIGPPIVDKERGESREREEKKRKAQREGRFFIFFVGGFYCEVLRNINVYGLEVEHVDACVCWGLG